jgi:hypothetical protein
VSFLSNAVRQPLFYFVFAGVAVFLVDAQLRRSAKRVEVPATIRTEVAQELERTFARPPTDDELDQGIKDWVTTELLFREASELGLENNDSFIRSHLATKLKNLVKQRTIVEPATEDELRAEFERHAIRYTKPDTYDVTIAFVARGDEKTLDTRTQDTLRRLTEGAPPESVGDHFPRGPRLERLSLAQLEQMLRAELSHHFEPGRLQQWQAVPNPRGMYVVRLDQIHSGKPTLESVRTSVAYDIEQQKRQLALEHFVEELRQKYPVHLQESP